MRWANSRIERQTRNAFLPPSGLVTGKYRGVQAKEKQPARGYRRIGQETGPSRGEQQAGTMVDVCLGALKFPVTSSSSVAPRRYRLFPQSNMTCKAARLSSIVAFALAREPRRAP